MRRQAALAAAAVLALAACTSDAEPTLPSLPPDAAEITVNAPSFTNGIQVYPRHTCDGVNLSPRVTWSGVPNGAASIAVVLNDPDVPGGSYIHWLVYDLPASATGFDEAEGNASRTTSQGGKQGLNSAGDLGYTGPCPPKGESHVYELSVYALDKELGLPPVAPRSDVLQAIEGSIVGYGVFSGRYQRAEREDGNVVFKPTPTP